MRHHVAPKIERKLRTRKAAVVTDAAIATLDMLNNIRSAPDKNFISSQEQGSVAIFLKINCLAVDIAAARKMIDREINELKIVAGNSKPTVARVGIKMKWFSVHEIALSVLIGWLVR